MLKTIKPEFRGGATGALTAATLAMASFLCAPQKLDANSADWPMWHGDHKRTAATAHPLPASLNLLWTRDLGSPQPAWPESQFKIRFDVSYEPVVVGKRIFVGSMVADSVSAFDTATGAELWRYYTDGPVRFAPVVWNETLYAGSDDGFLYALDTESGKLKWRKQLAPDSRRVMGNFRLVSMWPVRGGAVLMKERDGEATLYIAAGIWPFMGTFIYALDAETGTERWCNSGTGAMYVTQQHNSPAFAGVAPQGYMAVEENTLLVSGGRTVPAALNRHNGDHLYFEVSSRAFGKESGGYAVSILGDKFINRNGSYLISSGTNDLNLGSGKVIPRSASRTHGATQVGDGVVSVTDKGIVTWLGGNPATTEIAEARRAHFRAGNRLFMSGEDGWIGSRDFWSPDPERSEPAWTGNVAGKVWSMLPGDDKLFVVTEDGVMYAFSGEPPAGEPPRHGVARAPRHSWSVHGPEGYAVVWGLENIDVNELTQLTDRYHVIGIDPDESLVDRLRHSLDDAGWYGRRIHLLAGSPEDMELPQYMANYVDVRPGIAENPDIAANVWRIMRPYTSKARIHAEREADGQLETHTPISGDVGFARDSGLVFEDEPAAKAAANN